jgi:hypothetical protein
MKPGDLNASFIQAVQGLGMNSLVSACREARRETFGAGRELFEARRESF